MKRWKLRVLAQTLAGGVLLAPSLKAQHTGIPYVAAIVEDSVRAQLARDWDRDLPNLARHEKLYCLTVAVDASPGGGWIYRVTGARLAQIIRSSPTSVAGRCGGDERTPRLHTHPSSTCDQLDQTKCVNGGPGAYLCMPSIPDVFSALMLKHPFGAIQCDRHAIIFYAPQWVMQ
jgi:hypothetical protein